MKTKQISYNTPDQVILGGLIYQSEKPTKKILISTHGMATNCLKERDEIIAKTLNKDNIDYLTYNNRGHELVSYIKKIDSKKTLGGTAYEDIEESYEDILGTIEYVLENGYEEIYLQGHSLGATKTIYAYNKLSKEIKKHIKAVILLSLVDIPVAVKTYLGEKFPEMLTYAKNMEKEGMEYILMPEKSFIHPLSVKTFLKYARDYQNFDFARYSEKDYTYPELNEISSPLFMRWGNNKELILQKAEELCDMLKQKIKNPKLDINYIDQANHSYLGKEETLAKQIEEFILKI